MLGGAQSLASLRRGLDAISVVSPAHYALRVTDDGGRLEPWDAGNPTDLASLRRLLGGSEKKLVPLVACIGACAEQLSPKLASARWREQHAQRIAASVARDGSDGVFIDYEFIRCRPEHFTDLIRRIARSPALREKRVGVAVTEPCGGGPGCGRRGYPFDLAQLGGIVDYLAVMTYDYAVDGRGPIAPRGWIAAGMRRVRSLVGRRDVGKVYVGVPFYGRITRGLTRDTGVLWTEIAAGRVQGSAIAIDSCRYDDAELAFVADVRVGEQKGALRFHDHRTLARRLELIGERGLSGVAIWRLGGEDPCDWPTIERWLAGDDPAEVDCPGQLPATLARCR